MKESAICVGGQVSKKFNKDNSSRMKKGENTSAIQAKSHEV